MALIHIVYTSSATQPMQESALLACLYVARRNNARDGITGLLLYRSECFIQVLEGEEEPVRKTFARISKDPRHRGIIKMLEEPIAERSFQDWAMGFRNLVSAEVLATPGYSEFMNEDWMGRPTSETPGRANRLLQLFRRSTR